jgi:hypothetical protein
MNILVPQKKEVIRTPFRTLDEAMAAFNNDDRFNYGIDLFADLTVHRRDGSIRKRERLKCKSFVSNFIKFMNVSFRGGFNQGTSVIDICGQTWGADEELRSNIINVTGNEPNFFAKGYSSVGHMSVWTGPIIGIGTTAVAAADYWLEKPLTHGSAVLDLTPVGPVSGQGGSGTFTSVGMWQTGSPSMTDSGKAWSTDEWRHYLCKMTSGSANGRHFYIYDNTATTLYPYSGTAADPDFCQNSDDVSTDNYQILTYGQVTLGDTSFTEPAVSPSDTTKFTISRDFTNNQGSALTIYEFGLQVKYFLRHWDIYYNWTDCGDFLIVRDVDVGGIVINDGEKLTLSYRVVCVV